MDNTQEDIVILMGEGIFRGSSFNTFHYQGGLWSKVNIKDVELLDIYQNNSKRIERFINVLAKLKND